MSSVSPIEPAAGSTAETTVLVVDDEPANIESLSRIFQREGYRVLTAPGGKQALEQLRTHNVNVLLTDLMMPGMDGLELLRMSRKVSPESEVILMTAYGTIETAVEAMREGAYDFVTKPLKRVYLTKTVRRALEKQALLLENRDLKARLAAVEGSYKIIGRCPLMQRMMETVRQAAPSAATVLILGESGTGKELVARAVHGLSLRSDRNFVAVNCAAIPESIIESELFGYERGAFTGAAQAKKGRIEVADGGTLFLDEVGEMSPSVQVKLLRVLQEGELERVGGTRPIKVDLRVVAATNKDLQAEVRAGNFREDLFYRLNVVSVLVPSLRERREDIPLLVDHFLRSYSRKNEKAVAGISREALDLLVSYDWPGNVRELENVIERAVVLARGNIVVPEDLPHELRPDDGGDGAVASLVIPVGTPLDEIERRVIQATLKHTGGDKATAARLLGIAPRTIYRKVKSPDFQAHNDSAEVEA